MGQTLGNPLIALFVQAAQAHMEAQAAERQHQEQQAALEAQTRAIANADKKAVLREEQSKGQSLEENFADELKKLCKQWEFLQAKRRRGMNLDLLEALDETRKAVLKLKADMEKWKVRKPQIDTEIAALGGFMTERYTIKPGESFASLAQALLGNALRWKEIAALNPSVPILYRNGIPYAQLKAGDVVNIPSRAPAPSPAPAPVVAPVPPVRPPSTVNWTRPQTPIVLPPPPRDNNPSGGDSTGVLIGLGILGVGAAIAIGRNKKKKRSRRK